MQVEEKSVTFLQGGTLHIAQSYEGSVLHVLSMVSFCRGLIREEGQ